jgi:putative ABC transport system ATP-binding protein
MIANLSSESDSPLLTATGIHKTYGARSDTPVLRGIDLSICRGECVFLAGPSGSGKSTLLSILGCILTPDQGTIQIGGREVGRLNAPQRAILRRDCIGFVFQRFHLIRGLTALDNVCVPFALRGTLDAAARVRGAELLERVGLGDKINCYPQKLSSGQCQRVALARALSLNPDLILADEPTASLDAKNGQEVMELLRDLTSDAGKAAIVVTHDHRIYHFADRVLSVENGRLNESRPAQVLGLTAKTSVKSVEMAV